MNKNKVEEKVVEYINNRLGFQGDTLKEGETVVYNYYLDKLTFDIRKAGVFEEKTTMGSGDNLAKLAGCKYSIVRVDVSNLGWFELNERGKKVFHNLSVFDMKSEKGIELMSDVMNKLARTVKDFYARLMPVYPKWLFSVSGSKTYMTFVISDKVGNFRESFKLTSANVRKVWLRAGKDIYTEFKYPVTGVAAIYRPAVAATDDGNIYIRESLVENDLGLIRALCSTGHVLKGRFVALCDEDFTNMKAKYGITVECAALVNPENLKWFSTEELTLNTVVNFNGGVVKHQNYELTKMMKLHKVSFYKTFCKILPEYRKDFYEISANDRMKFSGKLDKVSSAPVIESILNEFQFEDEPMRSAGDLMKYLTGLTGTEELSERMARKLLSIRIPGTYVPAVLSAEVPNGVIEVPRTLYYHLERKARVIRNGKVTVIRYPVAGYQSYVTFDIRVTENPVNPNVCMVNPEFGKFLALDGDDNIFVTVPFSAFNGFNEDGSVAESISGRAVGGKELDLASLSIAEVYSNASFCEAFVGIGFNAMVTACSLQHDQETVNRIAGSLELMTQAIKKPYDLKDMAAELLMLARTEAGTLGEALKKHDILNNLYSKDGVVPALKPRTPVDLDVDLNAGFVKALGEINAADCLNNKVKSGKFLGIARRLIGGIIKAGVNEASLKALVIQYAALATVAPDSFVKYMDGGLIAAGYVLAVEIPADVLAKYEELVTAEEIVATVEDAE